MWSKSTNLEAKHGLLASGGVLDCTSFQVCADWLPAGVAEQSPPRPRRASALPAKLSFNIHFRQNMRSAVRRPGMSRVATPLERSKS
ncbi:hypothetical protein VFPFJ_08506 [Purpureocillium lilacinum]|uniref:Uncharacterized protein n=1 Tax=Purpureocillium lilacinum TaxID=33203 RepID=A0A179G9V3_PURLI|nr:hypothetical protein VFPFJ_08506 [Purpureocillium lilacinum]OAQ74597.1 hypothetical protein VFPBJ_09892 [Purpureocillium lilacinum]OAQ82703.1 hypothetical protein VFPFJ_08506 [Purpureocillium lilacinum]